MPIRGSGSDIEFGIRITADNQVFVDGVRASADEVKKLGEGLKQVSNDAQGATTSLESLTGAVFKGNVAMEAMRLAGEALVATFRTMVEEARANELAQLRTETVLRATGGAAQRTATQIDALSESMARSTFFDNNEIKNAAAQLATFGDIAGEAFDRTLKAGANLAALFGGDLASRTLQVAKALTEPATALGSLERAIGKLDPALRAQIKSLAEMGETARAQKLILDELDRRVGGMSENIKTGMVGALDDLKKSWRDLLGEIGKGGGEDGLGVKFLKGVAEQLRGLKSFIETGDWYVKYIAIFNPTLASMIGNQMAEQRGQNTASGTIKPAAGASGFSLEDQDARAIAIALANQKKYAAERKKILDDWLAAELKAQEILEDAQKMGARSVLDEEKKNAAERDRILQERIAAELKGEAILDEARRMGAEAQLRWDREQARHWEGFIGGIEGAFRAMWDAFAEGGANAAEVARSMLKRILFDWIYQAFARPIVLNIVAGGAGMLGMTGLANASMGAAGAAGSSPLGWSLTSALGSSGLAGSIGSWIGGEFGAGMMGAQLAGGTSFLGGAGSMLATAMPWLLPIAAIALLSGGLGRRGGPKEGGSFFGSYSGAGSFLGNLPVPGTDNGRFYTPSGADPTVAAMGGNLAQSYFATLARLGGTSPGASFGLGFDTDPRGSAQNRISSLVTVGGRQVFGSTGREVGRDDATLSEELQLEASRALLAALQASDLPDALAGILDTVDAASATKDQIDKVLELAGAFKDLTDMLGSLDLDQILGEASKSATERFQDQGRALVELAGKATLSTESLNQLTSATAAYKDSAVQLVLAFESAKQAIGDMFAETRRNIQLAGLDDQGRYNFFQQEADRLFAQLQNSTDPEEIQRLSSLINRDINAAFGLLSPEQQRAMQADYLTRLDNTNRVIQERLRALQEQTIKDVNGALDKISGMMEKLTAEQQAAATNQVTAANTQLAAASKPLRVEIDDRRVSVSLVNEGG